jgi:hypothetical protein
MFIATASARSCSLANAVMAEGLYGLHGVEPCVSRPLSTRKGVGYTRLHETIEIRKAS